MLCPGLLLGHYCINTASTAILAPGKVTYKRQDTLRETSAQVSGQAGKRLRGTILSIPFVVSFQSVKINLGEVLEANA